MPYLGRGVLTEPSEAVFTLKTQSSAEEFRKKNILQFIQTMVKKNKEEKIFRGKKAALPHFPESKAPIGSQEQIIDGS